MNIQNYSKNEQKALQLLFQPENYPGLVKRKSSEMELLLWSNNSLGDFTSWSLFQAEPNYSCRRVRWNQRAPYRLLEPETHAVEIILPKKIVESILIKFSEISFITHESSSGIMIDGIEYGVIRKDKKINWNSGREAIYFMQLIEWYNSTVDLLEELC